MAGDAWPDLFGAHLDAAYRLARWLIGNSADAEEVVQEACLRCWRSPARPDNPRAFLLAIVRNAAMTRLGRRRADSNVIAFSHLAQEATTVAAPAPGPEAALAEQERLALLRVALATLPPHYREVVVLRDIEDLPYAEIAAVLDLPSGTVMSRLARGRRRLRDLLKEAGLEVRDAG